MTYIAKPKASHPNSPRNEIGLTRRDYEGALSSLCAGCGHDSVTAAIVQAFFELSIPPHTVAKMSGIGCSSKTPGYFLSQAHGVNAVHGRMPSVTTGANLAHRELTYIAVSGDGDTGSIGIGQFIHAMRRNLNMLYIIENNGVYGLTKGQFSALADANTTNKMGAINPYTGIDPVLLALQLGVGFVARSFSGDKQQLIPLIKGGLKYPGFALIDVISPCVTFNNHPDSTRGYDFAWEHNDAINQPDFIAERDTIEVTIAPGDSQMVPLRGGAYLHLKKLAADYEIHDPLAVARFIEEHKAAGKLITGLLYAAANTSSKDLHETMNTSLRPLRDLAQAELCPGQVSLELINQSLR